MKAPLIAACLAVAGSSLAQVARDPMRTRVDKLLAKVAKATSMRFKATSWYRGKTAKADAKVKKTWTHGAREDAVTCWWRSERDVFVSFGNRWLGKRRGTWLVARKPFGQWTRRYLPDPAFLAERLAALPETVQWKASAETIDEKTLRVYSVELGRKLATRLIDTGALTQRGESQSRAGAIQIIRLGGAFVPADNTKRRFVIKVFEDPKQRFPVRIVADLYQKGGNTLAAGQVILRGGGGQFKFGGGDDDDEDEADTDAKPRPFMTTELEFKRGTGEAIPVLDDEARATLGLGTPKK